MEDMVCSFSKFGYCKYRKDCRRKHFSVECEDLDNCKNIKSCNKRHPKNCKRYVLEGCNFKTDCAYKHQNQSKNHEHEQVNEKVKLLEKIVQELSVKLLCLETELIEVKNTHVNIKSTQGSKKVEEGEGDKKSETKKEASKETSSSEIKKPLKNQKSKEFSVFRFGAESPKTRMDEKKEKEKEVKATDFKCETCEYKCKKKSTLMKHIKLKHSEQKCKICGKEFKDSMELVSHVAEDHLEEEEVWNIHFQSTPKSAKENEKSSFVFSESMLDEFL